MTDTISGHGDPTEWDAIPDELSTAIEAALAEHGWKILDAHDSAITIDVPGLDEDEQWCLAKPNFHGWWAWGTYERGYCPNPEWLYVDPTDPHAIAAAVDEILRNRAN